MASRRNFKRNSELAGSNKTFDAPEGARSDLQRR
jgi:hypothetical protein